MNNIAPFLLASKYIDFEHPQIIKRAIILADECGDDFTITKRCFEYVRDEIPHSIDAQLNPVTAIASDVLKYKTGFCYAKSHLLAALLRANNIPAGLCYQRLTINNEQPPYSLHGLNAVYLKQFGWYRLDARGNKQEVNAQFTPPNEQLAFNIVVTGEHDLPEIWAEPLKVVTDSLEKYKSFHQLIKNLPDILCY